MTTDRVAGLLLAAGAGRRMGMPKALVAYHGSLFVESAANTLREGGCQPVLVVLGAQAERVKEAADLGDHQVIDNPDWPEGMGASVRAGLRAMPEDAVAAVILPVDVPGVTPAAIARLREQAGPSTLARAGFHGVPGHPVVIGRAHWPGVIESAIGDVGARDYLKAHQVTTIPCEDVADGTDVDHPADLDRINP